MAAGCLVSPRWRPQHLLRRCSSGWERGDPGMGLDNRRPRGFSDRKIAARGHCAGWGSRKVGSRARSRQVGSDRPFRLSSPVSRDRWRRLHTGARSTRSRQVVGGPHWPPPLLTARGGLQVGLALVASAAQLPGFSLELGSARRPQAWVRSGEFTSWDCGGDPQRGCAGARVCHRYLWPASFTTAVLICPRGADGCSQGHAVSLEASSLSL